jgi:hypothetical protein
MLELAQQSKPNRRRFFAAAPHNVCRRAKKDRGRAAGPLGSVEGKAKESSLVVAQSKCANKWNHFAHGSIFSLERRMFFPSLRRAKSPPAASFGPLSLR